MKRALVTGGSGFLGRRLIAMLLERGHRVRALLRRPDPHLEAAGVEAVAGSLESRTVLMEACQDQDLVFHCAAKAGMGNDWSAYYESNVQGTFNLIEACRYNRVKGLIYTSTPSVIFEAPGSGGEDESLPYPESYLNHYSETKALAEKAVLEANGWGGMATTALRPHLIWGPDDPHLVPALIKAAHQGKLIRIGAGTNQVDLTFIDNAAWAHVLAGEALAEGSPNAGKAYFLSDGHPVNLWSWIGDLLEALALPPVRRHLSLPLAFRLGSLCEWFHRTFRMAGEPRLTRFVACQLACPHYYQIEAARRDFGYVPQVDPAQGLTALISSLKVQLQLSGRPH